MPCPQRKGHPLPPVPACVSFLAIIITLVVQHSLRPNKEREHNKLHKTRPVSAPTTKSELKASESTETLSVFPFRNSSVRIQKMLDSKSSALGSRTHPVYRGVQQQGPLPGHKIGSLAAIRHKNSSESSRLVRYHKGSRDLLDPTQAPPTPVQPASHLPPGRTLRRKPRLEDIRKVYEEQASRHASEQSLPKPEWGYSRLFSISSYGSDPVVENARVGLKTSALAAMVVDVDQGPEERAQARGTWRAFPLGSRRERRGVSRVDDAIIECRSPSASPRVDDAIVERHSPSASSREANQPPSVG